MLIKCLIVQADEQIKQFHESQLLGDTAVSMWSKPTVKRKTKIVCTIGPSTNTREMIWKLAEAGMNVARMNMSHGDHASHQKVIEMVKEYNAQSKDNVIAIMLDTKASFVLDLFFSSFFNIKFSIRNLVILIWSAMYYMLPNERAVKHCRASSWIGLIAMHQNTYFQDLYLSSITLGKCSWSLVSWQWLHLNKGLSLLYTISNAGLS